MTILCGTDLSENATRAALAAGSIAKRLGDSLVLAHVIDELGAELAVGGEHDALFDPAREKLRSDAQALASDLGIDVDPVCIPGIAHKVLADMAALSKARLLVVSALGAQKKHRWLLGSVAERVVEHSAAPVLVVRDGDAITGWARGERPLRVMVGLEPGGSMALVQWAARAQEIGVVETMVLPLVRAAARGAAGDLGEALPSDAGFALWPNEVVDDEIGAATTEWQADLVVVEAHLEAGATRPWQHSVTRTVIRRCGTNVVTVPTIPAAR